MKDKLEPNMYVRTKDGIILKVNDIEDIYTTDNIFVGMCIYDNEGHFINDVEITKASHNIIDLIEVGDYVNGYKVVKIDDLNCYDNRIGSKYIEIDFNVENDYEHWCEDTVLQNPNIKSIVTKEQFSSMEYRLGDDK